MNKQHHPTVIPGLLIAWLLSLILAATSGSAEDAPAFKITTKRDDDRVTVKVDKGSTIFDIRSPFGISNAVIERTADEWPDAVVLRLHLKALEYYQVTSGELVIGGSAPQRASKPGSADDEKALEATVRMLDENGKPASGIPLERGYFEIELPKKLMEANPKSFRVEWVDFYRN